MQHRQGFTLIEILIVVGIIAIVAGIVISSFFLLNQNQALRTSTLTVKSVLSEARSKTLAAENQTRYGVHIGSDSVILFPGAAYNAADSQNITVSLHKSITISANISGGGADIVFNRLTGETLQPGTITLSNGNEEEVITIYGTGIVE